MSTIVLRAVKNAPLTNTEVDNNFTNLNTDKLELGGTYSAGTANSILYLNSSKVATSGSALTFNGTTLGATGLNITGNTTLGDASTDTVQVNGYMGVGGAANTARGINVVNDALTGTSQIGVRSGITGTSGGTALLQGFASTLTTAAAAYTVADVIGYIANNPTKGAGSTITNLHGVYIADQTQGTNNYGITSAVSSGTNKWNIYASGTAANYFAGNLFVGDSTAAAPFAATYATLSSTTGSELVLRNSSGIVSGELVGGLAFGHDDPTTGGTPHYAGIQARSIDTSGTMTLGFYTGLANYEANTPQVLIDSSGNVGIGTSSPSFKQHTVVSGATGDIAGFGLTGNANNPTLLIKADATNQVITFRGGSSTSTYPAIAFDTGTGGEKMRLDSSGNLGLGVTPSAWDAGKVMQFSTGGAFVFGDSSQIITGVNTYYQSAWKYTGTGAATKYESTGGQHRWFTAPSGTAGNTISFSQVMTLNASGNLGIGTSSPAQKLHVASAGNDLTGITLQNSSTNGRQYVLAAAGRDGYFDAPAGSFAIRDITGSATRVVLDSSGNLGLGVTPSTVNTLAGYKSFEIGQLGNSIYAGNNQTLIGTNVKWDGSTAKYAQAASTYAAALYNQQGGAHSWATAPSGTAGAAITFTERFNIGQTEAVFNDTGNDYDFRVESDTNTHALFVEGSSGNVGIGTSTGQGKLSVGGTNTNDTTANSINITRFTDGRGAALMSNYSTSLGTDTLLLSADSANPVDLTKVKYAIGANGVHIWYGGTTGTERLRIDSFGNLGLGVTPSAWDTSIFKALQVGNGSALFGDVRSAQAGNTGLSGNVYYGSGAFRYINNNFAGQYFFAADTGIHSWSIAPSGTAGNAISFTQALTLDANRNLLLNGTTAGASAVGTLAIFNGTAPTGSVTDGIILYAEDVSSSSELKVRDEAGNVTTLSPHNFSLIPEGPSEDMAWAYYSEKGGKRINVDMLKLARMVEKLTGEKLVYES